MQVIPKAFDNCFLCWYFLSGKLIVTVFSFPFLLSFKTPTPFTFFSYIITSLIFVFGLSCFCFSFSHRFLSLALHTVSFASSCPSISTTLNSWCKPFTPNIPTREDKNWGNLCWMWISPWTCFWRWTSTNQETVLH